MYCYIELVDGEIVSYGESTSQEFALSKTTGTIMQITENEFALLSACSGNIESAQRTLSRLKARIQGYWNDLSLDN